jgi:hypothetical protein
MEIALLFEARIGIEQIKPNFGRKTLWKGSLRNIRV